VDASGRASSCACSRAATSALSSALTVRKYDGVDRGGQPKVVVDDVTVRFDGALTLDGLSLEIGKHEFVSIVGPSGSGKSTLFNTVSGLLRPTSGRVLLDGRDVTGQTGHVGYMLQKDLLIPWRTVVGNIVLGAALTRGVTSRDREEAAALATRYGLGEFLDHYPHALSGGMRQRVALMRTLALHTDVLLLDEPFGALDSQTRLDMQLWLLSVYEDLEVTILFVTHDVDEAILLADRVAVMSGRPGRILADLPIALPRPRGLDVLTSPEFTALKREVLRLLHGPKAAVPV
jgi:ABC-type nitrate/sulfonate/bicarbonate transport system ATPase subunit